MKLIFFKQVKNQLLLLFVFVVCLKNLQPVSFSEFWKKKFWNKFVGSETGSRIFTAVSSKQDKTWKTHWNASTSSVCSCVWKYCEVQSKYLNKVEWVLLMCDMQFVLTCRPGSPLRPTSPCQTHSNQFLTASESIYQYYWWMWQSSIRKPWTETNIPEASAPSCTINDDSLKIHLRLQHQIII